MLYTFRVSAGVRFLVTELVLIGVIIAAEGKLPARRSTQPSIPGDFAAAAVLPNYREVKPNSAYRQARDSPRKGTRALLTLAAREGICAISAACFHFSP